MLHSMFGFLGIVAILTEYRFTRPDIEMRVLIVVLEIEFEV